MPQATWGRLDTTSLRKKSMYAVFDPDTIRQVAQLKSEFGGVDAKEGLRR